MKNKGTCMTRLLVALFLVGVSSGLCAAEEKPGLADEKTKESYSLGYQFGDNVKKQPVDLDLEAIIAGVRDAFQGNAPKLGEEEMKEVLAGLRKRVWVAHQLQYRQQAVKNLKDGESFLAENAKKEGVITLPSGLQYKVLRTGTGPSPKAIDRVTVQYRGTLVDGTEFDSSYGRGEPSTVHVNGVVRGWVEALQLMQVGSKWQIFVPAELAYGERQFGRIPPNSTLIFELELLSIGGGATTSPTGPKPITEVPATKATPAKTFPAPTPPPPGGRAGRGAALQDHGPRRDRWCRDGRRRHRCGPQATEAFFLESSTAPLSLPVRSLGAVDFSSCG